MRGDSESLLASQERIKVAPWVLLSAFRYALGRHSYVVGDTIYLLQRNWHEFSPHMKNLILKETREYIKAKDDAVWLGREDGDIDTDAWMRFAVDMGRDEREAE